MKRLINTKAYSGPEVTVVEMEVERGFIGSFPEVDKVEVPKGGATTEDLGDLEEMDWGN